MNNVINFTSILKEKRNVDLTEAIPDMISYNTRIMNEIDEWDTDLVKEVIFGYKYRDIYDEVFEDKMQYC